MAMAARPMRAVQQFLEMESAAGLILFAAATLAMILDNSAWSGLYGVFLETPVKVVVGDFGIDKPLLLWINDGLMAVFFLLVGLEIKREVLDGELSNMSQVMMPAVAAVAGMAVPGLLYVSVNSGDPVALHGWAIPAATDIAFALGVLSLLGRRIPLSLRVFLAAVAIFDDLGAIVIIALFYTEDLSLLSLGLAGAALLALFILNRAHVQRIGPYILVGILLWVFVLKSGVHATLAGVALAMAIPLSRKPHEEDGATEYRSQSPLRMLEHSLHPWVAFGVLPVFAFANAGVSFAGMTLETWLQPVTLGIVLGLFVGKQVAIFGTVAGMVWLGLARLPEGARWSTLYGVATLCGIGFTMSLFVGSLAFEADHLTSQVRYGVIGASGLSALLGYTVLWVSTSSFWPKRRAPAL